MKELKFRKTIEEKYVEDILDTDLVGIHSYDDKKVMVVSNGNVFVGLSNKDNCTSEKRSADCKSEYVQKYTPKPKKVLLFDDEVEMLLWYNDK